MAKKKCKEKIIATKPDPVRPTTSPYISYTATLIFGPNNREYYVPESLLQCPKWIDSCSSYSRQTYVSDVDEDTGHVVVHYLHTGLYQTLNNAVFFPGEENMAEFGRAVSAYSAATKYMLHGLQHLAKEQIETLGAEMSVFDILNALKDKFSGLPKDEVWFLEYLEQKVKATFEKDHTAFEKHGLFDSIDDIALTRMLARWIVGLYSNKVSHLLEPPREKVVAIEEVAPVGYNAPEPALAEDDDWRFSLESSKKKKKKKAVEENFPTSELEPGLEPAKEPESVIDEWGSFTTTKKKKGKKLKAEEPALESVKELEPEPEPAPEPVQELEPVNDEWSSFATTKKKKKGKKLIVEEPAPESVKELEPEPEPASEPVQEPEPVNDGWGSFATTKKKKKGKKLIVEEPALELVKEPEPEIVPPPELESRPDPVKEPESTFIAHKKRWASSGHATGSGKFGDTQTAAEEDEICPARARHLLDGDEWKSCARCRGMIRQIAIQLAQADHSDSDGYEVVDRELVK